MMFFCFQAAQIPAKKAQSEANVSVCSEVSLIILIKFYFYFCLSWHILKIISVVTINWSKITVPTENGSF